jgi:F0F1-type ATP synthase assembly protein I
MAGLALLGYWLDSRFGTQPWGLVAGVVVGMVGGLYNLVKQSLQAAREAGVEDEAARRQNDSPAGPPEDGD